MFSSQTRAHTVNTRLQLATSQKGNSTVAKYINKMRSLGDEMATSGRPLEEEELVEYILTGLNHEYDPIVPAVIARQTPVPLSKLYAQLLAFETRLALMSAQEGGHYSANSVSHGRGRGRGGFGRGGGRSPSAGGGNNNRGDYNSGRGGFGHDSSNDKRPTCQVCKKKGHTTDRCWHRFDEDYVPEERTAATASGSNGHDTNWYTNSRATNHIASDLEKLAVRDKYIGNDQIHTTSGTGMNINHIGHSTIHTPCRQLQMNKILHVPQVSKNLISVHHISSDNNVFLAFHPCFFCIKDLDTRSILLKGPCRGALYPLPAATFKKLVCGVNKSAFGVNKPSLER
jgi:hypothetical protein